MPTPGHAARHAQPLMAEYVEWFNHRRRHGEIGHIPPVEYEPFHAGHPPRDCSQFPTKNVSTKTRGFYKECRAWFWAHSAG
jgi:hypothetical protein